MAASTVEEYFAAAPPESLEMLARLRAITLEEIEGGEEVISYGIPTVKRTTAVVYFAGYRSHIGFYPGAQVMADFEPKVQGLKRAKGSVQFPLDAPLPEELIREMIRARLKQMK